MVSKIEVDKISNQSGDQDSGVDLSTNDEVKIKTANTNHVVIDSAGNMGLGTTSVNNIGAANRVLEINGAGLSPWIHFTNNTSGTGATDGHILGTEGVDTYHINRENGTQRFHTNNTERMRLLSDGGFCFGGQLDTTIRHSHQTLCLITNSSTDGGHSALHLSRPGTGTETQMAFSNGYGVGGTIKTVGNNTTQYNTSSDYRLKENVVTDWDATSRLKQLKPSRFNFKENPVKKTVDGFLAHEVSSIVPEAISGEKDEVETYKDENGKEQTRPVYQGIDQSKLVPLLTKALQEAIAKIETLEAKVTALEGK